MPARKASASLTASVNSRSASKDSSNPVRGSAKATALTVAFFRLFFWITGCENGLLAPIFARVKAKIIDSNYTN
jgi:hypothetical protein